MCGRACHCIHLAHLHEWDFSIPPLPENFAMCTDGGMLGHIDTYTSQIGGKSDLQSGTVNI